MREGEKYAIDTDGDGLPDLYENTVGLDANNASDGSAVSANGYTNLENYLNGIVDGTIDKSKYETSTYPVIPIFFVISSTNSIFKYCLTSANIIDCNIKSSISISIKTNFINFRTRNFSSCNFTKQTIFHFI